MAQNRSLRPLLPLSAGASLWIGVVITVLMTSAIYLFVAAGR